MYKFLYNKTCTMIDKIIFWTQIVVGALCIISFICTLFGAPKAVCNIAVVLWFVVEVFEGCYYFYKKIVVTLPETEWLFAVEHEDVKDITHKFRQTAINVKRDNIFSIGLMKILFGVLMIVCLII